MFHKLITGPIKAVLILTEKIKQEVDKEMFSIQHIQQQLILLYTRYEMKEIGEDDFAKQEEELLNRLEAAQIREWEQLLSSDETENE